jgi:hypothetical protein
MEDGDLYLRLKYITLNDHLQLGIFLMHNILEHKKPFYYCPDQTEGALLH